jgi:hypothetical protein
VHSHPYAAIVFITVSHLSDVRKESVSIIVMNLGQADQLSLKAWSFFLDEGIGTNLAAPKHTKNHDVRDN